MFTLPKSAVRSAEDAMQHAANYDEWREAASEFDRLTGLAEWREEEKSDDYNYRLIRSELRELRQMREAGNIARLMFRLHEGLHGNLGNMANPVLHSYCLVGTKKIIEEYIEEVAACLHYVADTDSDDISLGDKIKFFKRTGRSFGRSALMLSGGASLGMFHLGVVKALWEAKLLPRVISGSSAGSIVASVVATHSTTELEQIFEPGYMAIRAFRAMGIKGVLKGRAIMDGRQLEHALATNVGDMTFEQAFERSGMILNITVSPTGAHQQSRLLNYLTAPNVYIRRASLASCAVPGLFPPVELEAKSFEGAHEPYMQGSLWCDGSIKSDLPTLRVARLHNANHYIVSQTNPHVIPFVSQNAIRQKGILPLSKRLMATGTKFTLNQVLSLMRNNMNSHGLGLLLDKAVSITGQNYSGDINIFASHSPRYWLRIISNPSAGDIAEYIRNGERASWPTIDRIRLQTTISRTFDECLDQLKREAGGDVVDTATGSDWRKMSAG